MVQMLGEHFFNKLAQMDPAEVCRRALCTWNRESACFELEVWGRTYLVYPQQCKIVPKNGDSEKVSTAIYLSVLFYLLKAVDIPIAREWISEKDIPGGEQFFRGPHQIPAILIGEKFGCNVDGFRQRCSELGGEIIEMGDAAFSFRFLPRVPVAVVLWGDDDEFAAEARLLFDSTIGEHLPLDVIFGISTEICNRIAK